MAEVEEWRLAIDRQTSHFNQGQMDAVGFYNRATTTEIMDKFDQATQMIAKSKAEFAWSEMAYWLGYQQQVIIMGRTDPNRTTREQANEHDRI